MRLASWAVVVCALIGATGVFLPSLEVEIHGIALGRRTSVSLYQAREDRDVVRRLLAAYRHSKGRRTGEAIAGSSMPRLVKSRLHLDDARDAMSSLDDISDADIRHVGTILAIAIWAFLALEAVVAGLVFVGAVRGAHTKRHLVGA